MPFLSNKEQSLLKVLLYFDLFNYPLTEPEIIRFCTLPIQGPIHDQLSSLEQSGLIGQREGFWYVGTKAENIEKRKKGNQLALQYLQIAKRHSRLLSWFPFLHGLCISGSLSKHYMDEKADIDYFLIAAVNRIWLLRFLLAIVIKTLRPFQSEKFLCLNYIISAGSLQIKEKNLYTAIEIATLIPTYHWEAYRDFLAANQWVHQFLPNWQGYSSEQIPRKGSGQMHGNIVYLTIWTASFAVNSSAGTTANSGRSTCVWGFRPMPCALGKTSSRCTRKIMEITSCQGTKPGSNNLSGSNR